MSVELQRAIEARSHGVVARVLGLQAFWVLAAALLAAVVLSLATESFATPQNLFNVTRNFAFVAIVAIGMTAVIITGGIDLSVGSILCIAAMVTGVVLHAGSSVWVGIAVVLISHRMPDVFAVADRIVVLRRGRKVADKAIAQSSPEEVTGLITGAIEAA